MYKDWRSIYNLQAYFVYILFWCSILLCLLYPHSLSFLSFLVYFLHHKDHEWEWTFCMCSVLNNFYLYKLIQSNLKFWVPNTFNWLCSSWETERTRMKKGCSFDHRKNRNCIKKRKGIWRIIYTKFTI